MLKLFPKNHQLNYVYLEKQMSIFPNRPAPNPVIKQNKIITIFVSVTSLAWPLHRHVNYCLERHKYMRKKINTTDVLKT